MQSTGAWHTSPWGLCALRALLGFSSVHVLDLNGLRCQALLRTGALSARQRCACTVSCRRPFWRALQRVLQRMERLWELPCVAGKLPALPPKRRHGRGGAFPEFRPIGVCKAVKLHEIVSGALGFGPCVDMAVFGAKHWGWVRNPLGFVRTESAVGV